MKIRKKLSLSRRAVAAGEALALEQGLKFSELVEKQLATAPRVGTTGLEHYWEGPALKPLRRAGDARHAYLQRKHA